MMKHTHILLINRLSKDTAEYTYDFGSTKNIKLTLSEKGISISADLNKVYDEKEMLSGNSYLFPDSLKKALLLYLLKYGKALMIKSMTVKIDNSEVTEVFYKKAKPLIYSMINGDLQRNIPKDFSSDGVFNYLLKPLSQVIKRTLLHFLLSCVARARHTRQSDLYTFGQASMECITAYMI